MLSPGICAQRARERSQICAWRLEFDGQAGRRAREQAGTRGKKCGIGNLFGEFNRISGCEVSEQKHKNTVEDRLMPLVQASFGMLVTKCWSNLRFTDWD